MRDTFAAKSFPFVHLAAAIALILCAWTLLGCLASGRAAQDAAKPDTPRGQGEPGKEKQTGKKPKEEEEETTKPPRKVPLRVGDEDLQENAPSLAAKPGSLRPADLEREAKRAKHPAVQELFQRLAKPHDVITMAGSQRALNVELIAEYLGARPKLTKTLTVHPYNDAWKIGPTFSLGSNDVFGVEPYEQLALHKVNDFLKSGLDRDPESKQYLPRLEMLQEAEKVLTAVLRFHDSALERGLRKGNAWNDLRTPLVDKLQEVQLDQLRTLADQRNWDAAFDLASRLAEAYLAKKDVQAKIASVMAQSASESLKGSNNDLTQQRLLVLEYLFPSSPEVASIRKKLRDQAAAYMEQARQLENHRQVSAAIERLEKARDIYPQLPGLRDFYLRLSQKNPVLYVGVHDIPEYFSPAMAYLDSEKQAGELLFENLVKLTSTPKAGQEYLPCLASDLPKLIPLGRQFTLTRGASWSDDHPVTAADVRRTVELFNGRVPEWTELLQGGARIDEDAFHINLTLRQGYLDPLSLMTFKILPGQHLGRADDADFARKPIGSGPYQLQVRDAGKAVFSANPYYEMRLAPGKSGLPRIREIQFFHSEDPAKDFQDGKLQLLLDLPTSRFQELDSAGLGDAVTLKTLPNRRIYFLAMNHRKPLLGNNQALRRAIAHAINREAILNDCFRAGLRPAPHRPLTGPYPPNSWACNPALKSRLFNPNLARAQAGQAKEGRAVLGRLTLKYPNNDPAVAKACEAIQQQIQRIGPGIELELKPMEPRALRHDVEELYDYDLAYYSWDYPDETYWLWPLFDPSAIKPGGRNFLGYQNDEELESLFHRIMSHRDPIEVKKLTHRVHEVFESKMPFIPLWQLDTHLAIHNSLSMVDGQDRPVVPHPLLIFTNVETWVLNKR
jgi:ABC-type oligopeptide transport system substrate-binding subunit